MQTCRLAISLPLLIALVASTTPAALAAQRLDAGRTAFAYTQDPLDLSRTTIVAPIAVREGDPPYAKMIVMGALAGTAGMFGAGLVGAGMEQCSPDEWFCGVAGFIVGASVGATVGIPVGVQMASNRRPLGAKIAPSLLVAAGAALLAVPTNGISLLFMPPVQLITAIAIESRGYDNSGERP